jgi:hypothetical protein
VALELFHAPLLQWADPRSAVVACVHVQARAAGGGREDLAALARAASEALSAGAVAAMRAEPRPL